MIRGNMPTLKHLVDSLEQLPAHELEQLHQQVQEHRHRLARKHQQTKNPGAHQPGKPLTPEEIDALMAEIVAESDYDTSHG